MKIKLCGFTEKESLQTAIAQNCSFLGFVFCEKSPRNISISKAQELAQIVPSGINKVAVVVNETNEVLAEIIKKFQPEFIQFHGNETPEFLKDFKKKFPQTGIIKAFSIKEYSDLLITNNYLNCADLFLFDSKVTGEFGGSGKKFDWNILKEFSTPKEWFLSGGLKIENIEEALKITKANLIDISSGIEEIRGKKSSKLIQQFMEKVKNYVG